MAEKPVYSTATGSAKGQKPEAKDAYRPGAGPLKMRLETHGRGGKAVTVLFNLPFASEGEARGVMQTLQSSFGCGATFKNGTIELRGDLRDRLDRHFAALGMKIVRAGG
jgi:translation initiation factor 1